MGTESKFKTFRGLYVRNKFHTALTVYTGDAKFSRVIWGGAFHHPQSSTPLSTSPPLMLCLLCYALQNISLFFILAARTWNCEFYDFHRTPQTGNNVVVACSLWRITFHVLFTMAYRFIVPFVCTCKLVRPSEIYGVGGFVKKLESWRTVLRFVFSLCTHMATLWHGRFG